MEGKQNFNEGKKAVDSYIQRLWENLLSLKNEIANDNKNESNAIAWIVGYAKMELISEIMELLDNDDEI